MLKRLLLHQMVSSVPFAWIAFLVVANFFAWRDFLSGQVVALDELCASGWAMGVLLYLTHIFSAQRPYHLVPIWWSPAVFVLWALLLASFLAPLPAIYSLPELWQRILFVIFSLLPVLPLKPRNLRFPVYQSALVWRSVAVPFWSYYCADLLRTAGPLSGKALAELLVGAVFLAFVGGLAFSIEYFVDWDKPNPEPKPGILAPKPPEERSA